MSTPGAGAAGEAGILVLAKPLPSLLLGAKVRGTTTTGAAEIMLLVLVLGGLGVQGIR